MDIKGKSALVTGAASGIGRALAQHLAARGAAKLILIDIDEAGLAETAAQVKAKGAQTCLRRADVSDIQDLEAAFDEAGRINYDICFNNAGIVEGPPGFPGVSATRIALLISINLTAVLIGTKRAIEHMTPRGGGVIINTGSTASVRANYSDAPYRASKAGVSHLTKCCKELAETSNIRVNAVHPGGTETPILGKMRGDGEPSEWSKKIMAKIRFWTADEIAEAAMGLVEDDSRIAENLVLFNEGMDPE